MRVERIDVSAFRIPTPAREADGTLEWDATTLVVVEARSDGHAGIGYTYADRATAMFIEEHLRAAVVGRELLSPAAAWDAMRHVIRNVGRPGVASMAIAAVDTAVWDLHARLRGMPLCQPLGARRASIPLYGSGGFVCSTDRALAEELEGWLGAGIRMAKIKVGRDAADDLRRVRMARDALGDGGQVFVDANGAYKARQAIAHAARFADEGVVWFEEPVSSDDLDGLARVRGAGRGDMDNRSGA